MLPSFVDPWYDPGSDVHRAVHGVLVRHRLPHRPHRPRLVEEMGWDILWDPTYKGVTSILDDYREGIAMALLRPGITDVNTTDEELDLRRPAPTSANSST